MSFMNFDLNPLKVLKVRLVSQLTALNMPGAKFDISIINKPDDKVQFF
ncbi:MAG: hypothetical protein CM1200mP1_08910 [Candidatus Neomarinimicrobiota bacterium]|nr:MAG: hypothetical protein CM1200mP1_08910 [Candidatus Neomarinimicrobiota bacterium]